MSVKSLVILTFCLLLQASWTMQSKARAQARVPNGAGYDTIGPYTIGDEPGLEKDLKFIGEIRAFLWEHWKGRRLARVTATFYTIEGDPTTSKFLVEPDTKGRWQIRIDSVSRIAALLPKGKRPRRMISHEVYDEINRVDVDSTSPESYKTLSENEVRDGRSFKLRLRNSVTRSKQIF